MTFFLGFFWRVKPKKSVKGGMIQRRKKRIEGVEERTRNEKGRRVGRGSKRENVKEKGRRVGRGSKRENVKEEEMESGKREWKKKGKKEKKGKGKWG